MKLRQFSRSLTAPAILILAAALRFYRLSGQSLWSDEGNSVALARRSFVEIAQRTAFDIHPPFYYWLLKVWIAIFGDSEIGLRSLSVGLGILVVYLIGVLGARLFSARVGLIAAFMAALSPLQIYYAQEARMYMLLTFLSALTALATLLLVEKDGFEKGFGFYLTPLSLIYILTVVAGFYTHYAYPLIFVVVNLVVFGWFWAVRSQIKNLSSKIGSWLILQLIPFLLYTPWLPVAWRQVTTWPTERQASPFLNVLAEISTTLVFGLSWPFDSGLITTVGLGVVILATIWAALAPNITKRDQSGPLSPLLSLTLLWLWFLLPTLLTAAIFTPAFLKFLLVAAPALALLAAVAIDQVRLTFRYTTPYASGSLLLLTLTIPSLISFYYYHTDSTFARDNYRQLTNFIKAIGAPQDAVILNAEGQQDVFNYYYEQAPLLTAPVYPLPRQRPLDEVATLTELQKIARHSQNVYAVYWAAHQADPEGLIEGWLNSHLFKATDEWYGNVRLVSYANPQPVAQQTMIAVDYQLGEQIRLTGYGLSAARLSPGDILQVALTWRTTASLTEDYVAFLQILDSANHLIGQRDATPLAPTSTWRPDQPTKDGHGVFIEPGTPPGKHRLILGLYHSQTGQRLPIVSKDGGARDFIELAEVEIVKPATPLAREAFKIQTELNEAMFEVGLLGYDFYQVGHRSDPNTPLNVGDPVQLVLYWTAYQPVYWLEDQLFIQVVTNSGGTTPLSLTRQPAGVDYPIDAWQPGQVVRAQHTFFLNNIKPGTYRLALTLITKVSTQRIVALSKPFRVE